MIKGRVITWVAAYWTCGAYIALMSAGWERWLWAFLALLLPLLLLLLRRLERAHALIILVVFALSIVNNGWTAANNKTRIELPDGTEALLSGTIASSIKLDGDRASFTMMTERIDANEISAAISERVRVNLRLTSIEELESAKTWQRGASLIIRGQFKRPPTASNWDSFDYKQYLLTKRTHWLFEVKGLGEVETAKGRVWRLQHMLSWADQGQVLLGDRLEQLFPQELQGLMKSQTIGLRDELEPELYRKFSHIGLSHILAISGLHVGIFTAVVLRSLKLLGLSRERCLLICIALIPAYALLTGAAPPVIRAGLMAMIGLEAARRNRLKDGASILGIAVILMLLWDPYMLSSISFQLSVLITLGLILGVRPVSGLLPIPHQAIRGTVAVTVVAQVVSFPLTIYYFNHFSLLSFPANLIFVPVISILVIPLTILALLLTYVSVNVAGWLSLLVTWMMKVILSGIDLLARLDPFGSVWPSPPVWWIVLYYLMVAVFIQCMIWYKRIEIKPISRNELKLSRKKWLLMAMLSATCLAMLLAYGYNPERWRTEGEVSFIDVGQGDAILVRTPDRYNILIDSGGTLRFSRKGEEWRERFDPYEVGKDTLVPIFKKRGIRQLDALILTHLDQDHIGGALAVLQEIPVRRIIFNGMINKQDASIQLFNKALELGIPIYTAERGRSMKLGSHTNLTFLHPNPLNDGISLDTKQNDASVVFLLQIYNSRFLMTGDMEERAELGLLSWLTGEGAYSSMIAADEEADRRIDVLKVAHHGSKTSTIEAWLEYWQPSSAVISAGRNNMYGHPHPSVVERLLARDIAIYRTDLQGEVRFMVTPKGMTSATKWTYP